MAETEDAKKEIQISKIHEGTVIDHISPGRALDVLRILGILPGTKAKISLVMNASSKIMKGGKDIVKIENRELLEIETNKIAIISPDATINIIRNYNVIQKHRVALPDEIIDIIKCSRPSCITNDLRESKGIKTKFKVVEKKPIVIECCYCDEQIKQEDIPSHMNY